MQVPPSTRAVLVAKGLTPPYLWNVLKRFRGREQPATPVVEPSASEPASLPEWEHVPEGWTRPSGGWDVDAIAEAYREKWPSFLQAVAGSGPLGVNHEVPLGVRVPREELDAQHIVLAFAYALTLAAQGKERLSLLDWGGGPGHYAVLAEALLPGVPLDYVSRDLPALAALGRELLPQHRFAADDGPLERTYDLVVASSSLHYHEDWRGLLTRLAAATRGYLYVTRVPVALGVPSFVVLQRAHAYGYDTEYLGWVLARAELLAAATDAGLVLQREILLPARFAADGAPEAPTGHRGFLFRTA
jgi:putative methyltransferase (TIGR04325 family)